MLFQWRLMKNIRFQPWGMETRAEVLNFRDKKLFFQNNFATFNLAKKSVPHAIQRQKKMLVFVEKIFCNYKLVRRNLSGGEIVQPFSYHLESLSGTKGDYSKGKTKRLSHARTFWPPRGGDDLVLFFWEWTNPVDGSDD